MKQEAQQFMVSLHHVSQNIFLKIMPHIKGLVKPLGLGLRPNQPRKTHFDSSLHLSQCQRSLCGTSPDLALSNAGETVLLAVVCRPVAVADPGGDWMHPTPPARSSS